MTEDNRAIIPLDVSDFVMAPETLIEKYGGMCALVYGRVWRYAQQELGVCTASHSKIAKALHVSRQTVQKYIALLVSEGFLDDATPDGDEYTTKHYATTPHLAFSGRITATVGGTPVKNFDRGNVKEIDKGMSKKRTTPVKNLDIKKEVKKDSKKKRLKDSLSFSQDEWMQALIAIKQDYYRGRHTAFDQYWGDTGFAGRQDGVFKVSCQEEQQEWLDDNGKKIAENMLVGVLGEKVEVEFISE